MVSELTLVIVSLIIAAIGLIISGINSYVQNFQGANIDFVKTPTAKITKDTVVSTSESYTSEITCCLINKGHGIGVVTEINVKDKEDKEMKITDNSITPKIPFAIEGKNAIILKLSFSGKCMEPQVILKYGDENKKPLISKPIKPLNKF